MAEKHTLHMRTRKRSSHASHTDNTKSIWTVRFYLSHRGRVFDTHPVSIIWALRATSRKVRVELFLLSQPDCNGHFPQRSFFVLSILCGIYKASKFAIELIDLLLYNPCRIWSMPCKLWSHWWFSIFQSIERFDQLNCLRLNHHQWSIDPKSDIRF